MMTTSGEKTYYVIKYKDMYLVESIKAKGLLENVPEYARINAICKKTRCEIYTTYLGRIMVWTSDIKFAKKFDDGSKTELYITVLEMDMKMSEAKKDMQANDLSINYEQYHENDRVVYYVLEGEETPKCYYTTEGTLQRIETIDELNTAIKNNTIEAFSADSLGLYKACFQVYYAHEIRDIRLQIRYVTESNEII